MKNNNMLTIVTIFIVTSIIISTLVYKKTQTTIIPIEDSYAYINNSNVLNKTKEEIIFRIKELDNSFNIDDYKISYNEVNEDESNALIYFTYYIDDLIETNKVYIVRIEDNLVKDIMFKTTSIISPSESVLLRRVKVFNDTKKEEVLLTNNAKIFKSNNILNRDKTINENKLVPSINGYIEKYEYNYTTEELSYTLTIYSSDTEVTKIIID